MRGYHESSDQDEFKGAAFQPSPLHRHPDVDGDDYGCIDDESNSRVAALVHELTDRIESGGFDDGDELIAAMRRGLEWIGETDTIVKENVLNALLDAVESSELEVDWMQIYGW